MTSSASRRPARFRSAWCLMATACLALACSGPDGRTDQAPSPGDQLFTLLPSAYTGVRFENRVEDTREHNVFTYRNHYNGGGVALGDLTGDGLPEVLLTANMGENRLYVNEGGFRFRDVTGEAGLGGTGSWSTGVTFADVNGDGLLDIYVCRAGDVPPDRRANALYVHQRLDANGVPRFAEQAAAYGVADEGYSTHAAFFDYDRDGDLDLYVVNNSPRPVSSFGLRNTRNERHRDGGDRLYRNEGGRFVDVSEAAGIFGSEIAFGLGVAVGDVSGDGWPDIYVSNDFFERDFLYINNRDGTFSEQLERQMPVTSLSSMGLDAADIDNDGWLDLYVMDMLPEDDYRFKTTTAIDGWDGYQTQVSLGFHHQFTRNMLQRNNGNGTFSEIGQLAGVARTDWSWSPLIADLDLDGYKDLYVTNGILRDVTDQDYIAYLASDETMRAAVAGQRVDFLKLIEVMHSTPLRNYAFRNEGHLTFANVGAAWGLNSAGFSNGAAYGDLDGDGAPDLVVNNINAGASVYRNNALALLDNRFLQVRLEGEGANRFGIGAKVVLRSADATFVQELMPSRGFQSSVDYVLTFGLGPLDTVPAVTVRWPDGRVTTLRDVAANQRLTVRQADAEGTTPDAGRPTPPLLTDVTAGTPLGDPHRENRFVDFRSQPLAPKMLSAEGPPMAVADVNGDGLDDVFLGGAREQPGQLLLQRPDGGFASVGQEVFRRDALSEDVGAAFFDATGDGRLDLYVVSGGSDFAETAPALQDRLYLNEGQGRFRKADALLPPLIVSGSRSAA
ncbi:MAG: VCBS repeat-containing protein, partial [Gemmatimonadota bacterium]|nr:VCBS repeat-containing protein [Gemmatimonadota bacterium]